MKKEDYGLKILDDLNKFYEITNRFKVKEFNEIIYMDKNIAEDTLQEENIKQEEDEYNDFDEVININEVNGRNYSITNDETCDIFTKDSDSEINSELSLKNKTRLRFLKPHPVFKEYKRSKSYKRKYIKSLYKINLIQRKEKKFMTNHPEIPFHSRGQCVLCCKTK